MTERYDAIVLGTGGVGSAAMYHLAKRSARVVGFDRFEPGHSLGSSHGHTRIIRQAYFEHGNYVPMLLRAYELWRELEDRRGEKLLHETGLLQVGSRSGHVISGVLSSAQTHGLEVDRLSAAEVEARFPGFRVPSTFEAVFERCAGYLKVEPCVVAHAEEAVRLGAQLRRGEPVMKWCADGANAAVETSQGRYVAGRLIITAGPWAGALLGDLGIRFTVLRKPLYWWKPRSEDYLESRGCPGYLFELSTGCFYGFPQVDGLGVKVAEHTGGTVVDDPLTVNRDLDLADQQRVSEFISGYMPGLSTDCLHHTVCMYTMTRDSHFVVDRHPRHPQIVFAAGLSGHGFKFTSVLGEALCQLALDGQTAIPIEFLSASRPGLSVDQ